MENNHYFTGKSSCLACKWAMATVAMLDNHSYGHLPVINGEITGYFYGMRNINHKWGFVVLSVSTYNWYISRSIRG